VIKTFRSGIRMEHAPVVHVSLAVAMIALLTTMAALNGGTVLTTSVWDGLTTTLSGLLSSTWVLALAFIALVAAVWQIAHGRGYSYLAVILGLLSVAIIGPTFVTTVATATRVPIVQHVSTNLGVR
jgi:hypothetical protein